MAQLEFDIDGTVYTADLLTGEAPESVSAFRSLLPLKSKLQHVRWSGYATWVNIEEYELPTVPRENHTVYPSRGDVLLYPGYQNDKEILIACGSTCFKSPAGEIAGNHVATLNASRNELSDVEEATLEEGAHPITVREA